MFNLPLTKSSQQRKTARHCKTPMKINIVSIGSYVLLFTISFMLFTIGLWHRAGLLKLWVVAPSGVAKCNFVVAKPIGLTNQI